MEPPEDDAPDWRLDRIGIRAWWSGPQLDAMDVLTRPVAGSTRCDGRVSVALDGTWRCSLHCSGTPVTFHAESSVADCSALRSSTCLCWHCLGKRIAFFEIEGDFVDLWRPLINRLLEASPDAQHEFVRRCSDRSASRGDVETVVAGVEQWLASNGVDGLVHRYPEKIAPGSPEWSVERAVCTAALYLERDAEIAYVAGGEVSGREQHDFLVEGAFGRMWTDLVEASGYPPSVVPVVVALSETTALLPDLLEAAVRIVAR